MHLPPARGWTPLGDKTQLASLALTSRSSSAASAVFTRFQFVLKKQRERERESGPNGPTYDVLTRQKEDDGAVSFQQHREKTKRMAIRAS